MLLLKHIGMSTNRYITDLYGLGKCEEETLHYPLKYLPEKFNDE